MTPTLNLPTHLKGVSSSTSQAIRQVLYLQEVLGMISQKHVNAEYIQSNKTDGIDIKEDNKVSFSTLIEWIFQQFKWKIIKSAFFE